MKNHALLLLIIFVSNCYSQPVVMWNNNFKIPNTDILINSAILDGNNRLIVGGCYQPNPSLPGNDYEPIVLIYDESGNLILNWTHADSLVSEGETIVKIDSGNNIYISTYCVTAPTAQSTLVKLDAINFNELFRVSYPSGDLANQFIINDSIIYYFQLSPINVLKTIDLNGNMTWSNSFTPFNRLNRAITNDNYLYLMGDVSVSGIYILKFVRLSLTTPTSLINTYTTNFQQVLFGDALVDDNDNLYYTGNTGGNSMLISFDSAFNYTDSTISNVPGITYAMTIDSSNNILLSYTEGNSTLLSQVNPLSMQLASTDSAYIYPNVFVDLATSAGDEIYLFNSRRYIGMANPDYQITSFDAGGNINWVFDLSNDSARDLSYKIFYSSNSLFCVGQTNYPWDLKRSINTFKLSSVTGISFPKLNTPILVYPNPLYSKELRFEKPVNGEFSLFNLNGQLLDKQSLINESSVHIMPNLKSGLYVGCIKDKTSSYIFKISYYEQ